MDYYTRGVWASLYYIQSWRHTLFVLANPVIILGTGGRIFKMLYAFEFKYFPYGYRMPTT